RIVKLVDDCGNIVISDRSQAGDFTDYRVADAAKVLMCFEQVNDVIARSAFFQAHCQVLSPPSLAAVAGIFIATAVFQFARCSLLGLIFVILLPWIPNPAISPFWPKMKA